MTVVLGIVRDSLIYRDCADGQPAALVLKPGYIALRPTTTSLGTEKGMFKSSRYIRLLVACFVASYPFFIPPYVSINLRS